MTNLTEQWKKGELPYAEYYIKLGGGEYTNDVWDVDGWQSFNKEGDVVVEVLAPVPSYQEYIAMKKLVSSKIDTRNNQDMLLAENTKLKELLKECKLAIFDYPPYDLASDKIRLQIKINQVLGEE